MGARVDRAASVENSLRTSDTFRCEKMDFKLPMCENSERFTNWELGRCDLVVGLIELVIIDFSSKTSRCKTLDNLNYLHLFFYHTFLQPDTIHPVMFGVLQNFRLQTRQILNLTFLRFYIKPISESFRRHCCFRLSVTILSIGVAKSRKHFCSTNTGILKMFLFCWSSSIWAPSAENSESFHTMSPVSALLLISSISLSLRLFASIGVAFPFFSS